MIVDFHVHPPTNQFISCLGELFEPTLKYFRANFKLLDFKAFSEDLRNEGISKAILLPLVSNLNKGGRIENEHIREICNADPDLFLGFASFDLNKDYISELKHAINNLGLKGIKVHPQLQNIRADDPKLIPIYEFAEKHELPIVIHTGITGIGANIRGGGGLKLDHARPIYVDNIASQFPNVTFIMAHFGWPWYEEALAVAYHKANVYIDISGWSPKYIPQTVIRYMDSLLQDRVLFGSDYPMIRPSRIIAELKQLNLKEQTIKKVLFENALQILNKL